MESFFRKLQEVTELPGEQSVENDEDGGGESAEELRERLAASQRQVEEWKAKWSALQAETSTLADEYTAYKTKVSTWRDQMRAARSQDRRTIELLRQSAASSTSSQLAATLETSPSPTVMASGGASSSFLAANPSTAATTSATPGGHAAAPNVNVEAVYVHSLEEQIRSQKEALRLMGDERDRLRLELRRATEQRRETLARLAAEDTRSGNPAHSDPSSDAQQGTVVSGGDSAVVAAASGTENRRLQLMLDSRMLEIEALQRANNALEVQVEQLNEEIQRAAEATSEATRELHERLQHAEELLDGNRQVQYIRSLESEVRMWKAETQIARAGLAPAGMGSFEPDRVEDAGGVEHLRTTSPNAIPPSSNGDASQSAAALQEARAQLEAKDVLLADLRKQLAQLAIESSMRDEALDQMFVDCRSLEASLRLSAEECNTVRSSKIALQRKLQEVEITVKDLTFQRDEALDRASRVSQQHGALMKEHARVNDILRGVKQDLARRCGDVEGASSPSSSSSARRPNASGNGGGIAAGAGAGAERDGQLQPGDGTRLPSTDGPFASSTASADAAYVSGANLDRLLERYQLHQLASARQQVFHFWNQVSQQRRFSVSHARWRSLVAVALFLLLALLFTSYQAMSVLDEEGPHHSAKAMEDALSACHAQLARAGQTLPSTS